MTHQRSQSAFKKALILSVSTGALLSSTQAFAALDELVVTATKREASVQSIPYNIAAFDGSQLKGAGISSGQDLLNLIPGVFASDQGGRTGVSNNISIRGLNANNPAENNLFQTITEPPVSTYINDTPLFLNLKLTDVSRVEVLRGPQGTLYGSGSVGGTIRYIMNRPEIGENNGEVSAGISIPEHSDELNYTVDGVANFSLGEKAALRIVAGYETLGGVIDANGLAALDSSGNPVSAGGIDGGLVLAPKEDTDDQESWYARASLLLEPTDSVDLLLTYMRQENEYDGDSVRGITNVVSSDGPDWEHDMRALAPGELETDLVSLEANVDLGFASFTSATAYTKSKGDFVNDVSGLYDALNASYFYYGYPREVAPSFIDQEAEVFTQELRLVSQGDGDWDWVIGAFYKDEKKQVAFRDTLLGFEQWGSDPTSLGSFIVFTYYGFATLNDWLAYYGDLSDSSLVNVPYAQDREMNFEDIAIFGELTYHITDAWQVTAGARAFWQDFEQDNRLRFRYFGGGVDEMTNNSEEFDDQVFKVNTSYQINEDTMIYFTWSEGFRHGGANGFPTTGIFAFDPALIPIQPDEVTNYEAGVKGDLMEGDIRYTASVFFLEWDDVQLDTFLGPLSVPSVVNGRAAESKGFELDVTAQATENFQINFGYSYIDAEITEDSPTGAFDGDPLAGVSEHTVSLMLDYFQPLANMGELHWHLDGSYRSDFATGFNSSIDNFAELDGFDVWNASLTWNTEKYSLGAFVKNITDEEGVTAVVNSRHATSPFDSRANTRRPRTYGIQGTIRF